MFNNKQKKFLSNRMHFFVWLAMITTPCFATMDVMDEDTEGYYGNAETRPFKEVVDNTEVLTARDKAFMEGVEITRITERSYFRVLVGHPQVRINAFENKSSPPADSFQIAGSSKSDRLYTLLIAGGHIWEQWAMEGEFLITKKVKFNLDPFLFPPIGPIGNESASGYINQYALLFNLSYILPRWLDFYPRKLQIHLDAGFGPSLRTANLTTVDGIGLITATKSKQTWAIAGMLGFGARYQITPQVLVNFAYRFIDLGKTKLGPIQVGPSGFVALEQSMKFQSNQTTVSGFFVGLTYQV